VLQIDSTGLATGKAVGESVLTAEVTSRRGIQSVLVLSAATYRLNGSILDATWGDPVPGARLEAVDATGSLPLIAVATSGPDGRYTLYGVPAVSDIRVTHDAYVPTTTRVELASHSGRNFSIVWDTGGYDFTGAYTLTIEADDACPSAPNPLPPDLRRRTFPAEIQQAGSRLTVSVGGRCIHDSIEGVGCRLTGRASTSGATFQVGEAENLGYYRMPDLVERLGGFFDLKTGIGATSGLWFLGVATTNISATGLSGHLAGTITLHSNIFPAPDANGPATAGCGAGRFDLSRR
jgi:hypothetical protein